MPPKSQNIKVLRMVLPGGQNDRTPQESIFKLSRRPQLPYTSKIYFTDFLYNSYIYIYMYGVGGMGGALIINIVMNISCKYI